MNFGTANFCLYCSLAYCLAHSWCPINILEWMNKNWFWSYTYIAILVLSFISHCDPWSNYLIAPKPKFPFIIFFEELKKSMNFSLFISSFPLVLLSLTPTLLSPSPPLLPVIHLPPHIPVMFASLSPPSTSAILFICFILLSCGRTAFQLFTSHGRTWIPTVEELWSLF